MSSKNVHSQENIYCAVASFIPTEREVEIPPKNAKKGPAFIDVIENEGAEIPLFNSTLDREGKLRNAEGELIAKFSKVETDKIIKKYQKQKVATKKSRKNNVENEK